MLNQHQVRLIDGEFEVRDALQIIDTLLEAKINFHRSQRFGHSIRGTEDRVGCSQRIAELQDARRRFASYIANMPEDCNRVSIKGNIALLPVARQSQTAPDLVDLEVEEANQQ